MGKEEVKVEKKPEGVQVVQVATETQELFQVNGEVMNLNQYLCWLGNELVNIRKAVSG